MIITKITKTKITIVTNNSAIVKMKAIMLNITTKGIIIEIEIIIVQKNKYK